MHIHFVRHILTVFLTIPFLVFSQTQDWDLSIQNDVDEWLTYRISFDEIGDITYLNIKNAEEIIRLSPYKTENDTVFYRFINYNAEIAFTQTKDNLLTGYWINFEKEPIQKRLIKATPKSSGALKVVKRSIDITGEWKTEVILPDRSYMAILALRQDGNKLYGTMRTNAGDYQYLEGEVDGGKFYVNSFNGNSVFQLNGYLLKDTLIGQIHTVIRSNIKTVSVKDDEFELVDPETATKVVNNKPFNLDLKDELGEQQSFSKLTKNKVTVVSIFGTWCPNCVDETDYFNELQKKYPELQIISVAFEATDDVAEQQRRVQGFKTRKNINLQFLLAEKANKENVLKRFPMIDNFSAFPTTFLIDRKGKIVKIHTGFNGPATGILYDQFKESFENQIRTLMKKK